MTKKVKYLIAIGVVSIIILGVILPLNRKTINNQSANNRYEDNVAVNPEGKPANPGDSSENKTINPDVKLKEKNDNTTVAQGNSNDNKTINPKKSTGNNTIKPENKLENKPENKVENKIENKLESKLENKPVVTPENKPTAKPESKPTVKPESKPTVKPEKAPDNNNQTSNNFSEFQKRVSDLVNLERSKVGCNSLKMNAELSKVATIKCQDMIDKDYFEHNSPTFGTPFDMMNRFRISYKTAGENIAMGQTTPEEVMKSWMNSPGHRKNILSTSFTEIGIGLAKNSKGEIYWTQMFIGK